MFKKILSYLFNPSKIIQNLNNRYENYFLIKKKKKIQVKDHIHFLHVGKCAGTTISFILKKINLSSYNKFFFYQNVP